MNEENKILEVFENTGDFGSYYLGDYSNVDIAKFIRKILKEKEDLQQRIDKAIFFINTTFDNYLVDDYIKNNLLEILKRCDKNVSSEIKRDN